MKNSFLAAWLLALAVALFIWGSTRQALLVNTDMGMTDQSAYMRYAKELAQTNLQAVGERNRMPVYPALMSLFYRNGMSDEGFFVCGKYVGIAIGFVILAMAFLVLRQGGRTLDAITATLVAMFTVFAYRAPYFQAEVLYYGLSFLLFFLLLMLLRRPRIVTAALAGFVGGVAHLTKASVLPAIALAAVLLVIRGGVELWRRYHTAQEHPDDGPPPRRVALFHLCCASVLLVCFLLVIFPYIRTSKERFGRYFYNVNSTFYMWYDSWEQAKEGTRAHGDRVGWPDMSEEDIPSLHKYLQDHTFGEILGRLVRGYYITQFTAIQSYGYAEFILLYALALAVLFAQNSGAAHLRGLWRKHSCALLFVIAYFAGYLSLYAWYTPVVSGNRFILTLFLPAMQLFVSGLSYAHDHGMAIRCFGRQVDASAISPAILLFLTVYLLTVYPYRISTMYAGR